MHPNVATCYYVRTIGGIVRVFAEYAHGGSLKSWIDSGMLYQGGEHQALLRILDVAIQTARGLKHAHTHGILHQDVKPENVVMEWDGTARLTDFGLASGIRHLPEATEDFHSGTVYVQGAGLCTVAYALPERCRARTSLGLRTCSPGRSV